MEARHQALQAHMATLVLANHPAPSVSGRYVVGRALATPIPMFTCDACDTAGCNLYHLSLERHFKAHGIPDSHWANQTGRTGRRLVTV